VGAYVDGSRSRRRRRPHVGGALGAALLSALLGRRWLRRRPEGRALAITAAGRAGFEATFGASLGTIRTNSNSR
jgi:hypothetical protein